MAEDGGVRLEVCPATDDDAEKLAQQAGRLRDELLELDVQSVNRLQGEEVPADAKGVGAVAGWLAVQLGPETLRAVVAKVADWVTRNNQEVEITLDGDTLKLGRTTREQREKIIDDWLARHSASS